MSLVKLFSWALAVILFLSSGVWNAAFAQETLEQANASTTYSRAKIVDVETHSIDTPDSDQSFFTQTITLELLQEGTQHQVRFGSEFQPLNATQLFEPGQTVVIQETLSPGSPERELTIIDTFRLGPWVFLLGLFLLLVFVVARWRGLFSVVGMSATIVVLSLFLIPAFLQGYDPLVVSILGSVILAAITIYITHGWNIWSHIAFVSIIGVLILVGLLAYGSVRSMQLTGTGTEEALFLQFLSGQEVRLQGLLLGGILLGTLGVLDDIVVSQIAVVRELWESKPTITFPELFQRSLRVGQTHVASLVNTLVLVYAGANLPLFLLFSQSPEPLWVTLNSELIMEEVVRTLAGSIGLVTAVPISTFLAAASLLFLPKILDHSLNTAQNTSEPHRH